MSALLVMLVKILAEYAEILVEASTVGRSTAVSDITEMTGVKSKSIFNRAHRNDLCSTFELI